MPPLRSIAFVINAGKPGASGLARILAGEAHRAGIRHKKTARFPLPRNFLRGCDACCVIGGDGTLLGVAAEAARAGVPIIGVNRGSLGFLTTFSEKEARLHFSKILGGAYDLDRRSMLECSTGSGPRHLALNDVLIKDQVNSRLVHLEVFADGELVTDYLCDGLIFSTPTGSTAYNLSAGGPILHPGARVIAMTPICPHTLTNRSIIFRDDVRLRVLNRSKGARLLVGADGHRDVRVSVGAPVEITLSKYRLSLAQQRGYSHFAVVRTKLKWSGGGAERS